MTMKVLFAVSMSGVCAHVSYAANLTMTKMSKDMFLMNVTGKLGSCATQPGQDCSGNDLRSEEAGSPDDCCSRCQITPGCTAFTWNTYDAQGQSNPTCYMKSACSSTTSCPTCTAGTSGPVAPTPAPAPAAPTPKPSGTTYCPAAGDLTPAYDGGQQIFDQGWTISGGGGVATKAAFNLLGGFVEYDLDLTNVPVGVNANIYSISPPNLGGGGYTPGAYCDGADNDVPWCVEVDWLESNGNCGGATTLHTVAGPGNNGCTSWGCRANYHYNGVTSFHMRVEFGQDGSWTTIRDGQVIAPSSLSPAPGGNDWATLADQYRTRGAVVYSSQWVGWVPVDDCGGGGDLGSARFTVKNLQISGSVVQGPEPAHC